MFYETEYVESIWEYLLQNLVEEIKWKKIQCPDSHSKCPPVNPPVVGYVDETTQADMDIRSAGLLSSYQGDIVRKLSDKNHRFPSRTGGLSLNSALR
nr:unnamed protein product [Spirometra erinaceieuropaei]